jgi:hypothetical protein
MPWSGEMEQALSIISERRTKKAVWDALSEAVFGCRMGLN